jgi:hypothetical protein
LPVVRVKVLGRLGALVALAGAVLAPAHATGYWVVAVRWGSVMAGQGSRTAIVTLQDVQVAQEDPDQQPRRVPYACLSVRDTALGVSADACPDARFTIAPDFTSATAAGSTPAPLRRISDGRVIGQTVLHYDVTWVDMSVPGPRAYGSGEVCPSAPWAPEWMVWGANPIVDVYSIGSAIGTVSADAIGSVTVDDSTLSWWTALGESAGVAAFGGVRPDPLTFTPGCAPVTVNPIGV